VKLDLSGNPGNATLESTSGLSKATVGGRATWGADDDLRITKAAGGYRILASGVGAAGESDAFDVLAGSPDHVTITTQPVSSMAGENLTMAVELRDVFENLVAADGAPITLSLTTNPGNATLEVGTSLTKTTVAGGAAWNAADALRISVGATGYGISASDGTRFVQSELFDIAALPEEMPPMEMPTMGGGLCGTGCGAGSSLLMAPLLLITVGRMRRWRGPRRVA
jgi:hypothetical protein